MRSEVALIFLSKKGWEVTCRNCHRSGASERGERVDATERPHLSHGWSDEVFVNTGPDYELPVNIPTQASKATQRIRIPHFLPIPFTAR